MITDHIIIRQVATHLDLVDSGGRPAGWRMFTYVELNVVKWQQGV